MYCKIFNLISRDPETQLATSCWLLVSFHLKLCSDTEGEITISTTQNCRQKSPVWVLFSFDIKMSPEASVQEHHPTVSRRDAFMVGVQREIEGWGHVRPPSIRRQSRASKTRGSGPQMRFVSRQHASGPPILEKLSSCDTI